MDSTHAHILRTQKDFTFFTCHIILDISTYSYVEQWEGMGDVGSARYEPALLPPCPTITGHLSTRRHIFHHKCNMASISYAQTFTLLSYIYAKKEPDHIVSHFILRVHLSTLPCVEQNISPPEGTFSATKALHCVRRKDLFIDPQECVVGYSKAPEQPQSSARPIYVILTL